MPRLIIQLHLTWYVFQNGWSTTAFLVAGFMTGTTAEIKQERRKHRRHIFNYRVEIWTANGKNKIRCASYDLSEGGIRVVTNIELKDMDYLVILDGHKLGAKLIYEEKRLSTMMNQTAFYHGLRFTHPLSSTDKDRLLKASQKTCF